MAAPVPKLIASTLLLSAVIVVLPSSPALGQDRESRVEVVPVPPAPPNAELEALRARLDRLYRSVFELSAEMNRTQDPDEIAALQSERRRLVEELRTLERQLEELDRDRPRRAIRIEHDEERDEVRADSSDEPDWEEFSRQAQEGLSELGTTLGEIGELLEGSEIEVDPNSLQFRDPSGSRVRIHISEEMRENIAEGLREFQRAWEEKGEGSLRDELERLGNSFSEDGSFSFDHVFGERERRKPRRVVGGTRMRLGEDVEIADDEIIDGDVYVIGADVYLAGEVRGTVVTIFGDLFVEDEGEVQKNAYSAGGKISVDETSVVHGDIFDFGSMAPGLLYHQSASGGVGLMLYLAWLAFATVLLFVTFAVVEGRMHVANAQAERNVWRDLLYGAIWFTAALGALAVLSVGLAITVIGIPVVVVLILGFAAAALWAYFISCQLLGERLMAMMVNRGDSPAWRSALLGLAILETPALLAAGVAGLSGAGENAMMLRIADSVIKCVAISIGVGALVATRLGTHDAEHPEPSPAPAGEGATQES